MLKNIFNVDARKRMRFVTREQVNLNKIPTSSKSQNTKPVCIHGDCHGNSINILFRCIHSGIITGISAENYRKLVDIYSKPTETITKNDLHSFKTIIQASTVNTNAKCCFLGDMLADRGNNDIFTLYLIEHLSQQNADFDIIFSNHDASFVDGFFSENPDFAKRFEPKIMGAVFERSMQGLQTLLKKGLVSEEEVTRIVLQHYLPHLKLLNAYPEEGGNIHVVSHAPIDYSLIKIVADTLNVKHADTNTNEFMQTIDRINESFMSFLKNNYAKLPPLLQSEQPLFQCIWNRYSDKGDIGYYWPARLHNVRFTLTHGHDMQPSEHSKKGLQCVSLDSILGKSDAEFQGELMVVRITKPQLSLLFSKENESNIKHVAAHRPITRSHRQLH